MPRSSKIFRKFRPKSLNNKNKVFFHKCQLHPDIMEDSSQKIKVARAYHVIAFNETVRTMMHMLLWRIYEA